MQIERTRLTPGYLLFWCLAGAATVQLLLWYVTQERAFSPIFFYLLKVHDTHGNFLLAAVTVAAFLLHRRAEPLALVRLAAERPWLLAAVAFPALSAGSIHVYEAYPLSMDEYSTLFQGYVFASGNLSGAFPVDLLDRLVPRFFQAQFFSVSRATGEVSTWYWPAFSLFLAPFCWAGIPWAANPLIAALTIPAIHGITRDVTGSRDAGGWAVLFMLASPVFIATSISFYSMPAHLLCSLWYAWLLLRPTPRRAALAGLVGSIALTLHFPWRHCLFAAPIGIWLLVRPDRLRNVGALLAGYVPLGALLGLGWQAHLIDLASAAAPEAGYAARLGQAAAAGVPGQTPPILLVLKNLSLPSLQAIEGRIAGLSKVWTWGAAALMVLALYGSLVSWRNTTTRILLAALAATFFGYFIPGGDQGHGWGNRAIYGAWFIFPLLAAQGLTGQAATHSESLRAMAAWGIALSLIFANGLRLLQVDSFVEQHLRQVPPLTRPADAARPDIVFINIRKGFYTQDMIRNDPYLRGSRIVMVLGSPGSAEALMAARFPAYRKKAEGDWGQWWERADPS
jgi:hypothetical protein